MSFFVQKNEVAGEWLMDPKTLMKAAPDYYGPKFDAIKELRDADDGTGYKNQEFRRVASFVNVPMIMASKISNPDFLRDKKRFYAFIDRHPEYVTYQRRNGGRGTAADTVKLPLSALGIDYPGAPESMDEFEPVLLDSEIPLVEPSTAEVVE